MAVGAPQAILVARNFSGSRKIQFTDRLGGSFVCDISRGRVNCDGEQTWKRAERAQKARLPISTALELRKQIGAEFDDVFPVGAQRCEKKSVVLTVHSVKIE